jgi:hypothetical protein
MTSTTASRPAAFTPVIEPYTEQWLGQVAAASAGSPPLYELSPRQARGGTIHEFVALNPITNTAAPRAAIAQAASYLPTHMGTPEIAAELYLSANTVRTHVRHLYQKLGAHSRPEAVQHARAIGLLTASSRGQP